MNQSLCVNSRAGINDGKHYVGPYSRTGVLTCKCVVEYAIRGGNTQGPPRRHRVSSVYRQIHDDLLDLATIGFGAPQVGAQLGRERDVLSEQPGQHFQHVLDQLVQVENGWSQDLLATKGKELASQRGGALAGFVDFGGIFGKKAVGFQFAPQQLAVSDDYAQQIVEIVCDTAGEATDGFHFRGHLQLPFEHPAFGNVFRKDIEAGDSLSVLGAASGTSQGGLRAVQTLCRHFDVAKSEEHT